MLLPLCESGGLLDLMDFVFVIVPRPNIHASPT